MAVSPLLLFSVGACFKGKAPATSEPAAQPAMGSVPAAPSMVSAATASARLPTFEESREAYPISWVPKSWYCRWIGGQEQNPQAAQTQLLNRAAQDWRWERRMMDIFAWDTFLAINWPYAETNGTWSPLTGGDWPKPRFPTRVEYSPYWASWHRRDELKTKTLSSPRNWRCEGTCLTTDLPGDEVDATDPIWDQNGESVHFELRVNPTMMTTLQVGGDAKYMTFTNGQCKSGGDQFELEPAVEMKLAWKVLGKGDRHERFFTMRQVKLGSRSVDLGLVGMHIASKVKSRDWIAMTFEQMDNVPDDSPDERGRTAWSFTDPNCETCCANNPAPHDNSRPMRTQLTRTIAIDGDTKALNQELRGLLGSTGSLWQYYQLVGTQYYHNNNETLPTPKELRNTVIEPYLVSEAGGPGCPSKTRGSTCLGCHNRDNGAFDFSFVPAMDLK